MSDLTFIRCTKGNPCPICGASKWCSTTAEGPVKCMRADLEGHEAPHGLVRGKQTSDGGRMFVPEGFGEGVKLTAADKERARLRKEQIEREQLEKERKRRNQAKQAWRESERSGAVPRAYIRGRGIDIEKLPGQQLPSCIRYNPTCNESWVNRRWTRAPAMVCEVVGADGKQIGLHRTFLGGVDDLSTVEKRHASAGEAKKQLGPCSGGAVRLSNDARSGVLVLTEGIETGLACLQATGAAVWACMDAPKLMAIEIPADLVAAGRRASVAVVIIAADLDAPTWLVRRKLEDGRAGPLVSKHRNKGEAEAALLEVSHLIRSAEYALTRLPPPGQHAASVLAARLKAEHPHLLVEVRAPSPSSAPGDVIATDDGVVPATGKSVDWLDVLEDHGADVVRQGLLSGIDVEDARQSALHATPPADAEGERRVIDPAPRVRAQKFLIECEAPPEDERAKSAFYLQYALGTWWEYDGRAYRELPTEVLEARVWSWLDQFYTQKRGDDVEPMRATERDVASVMAAMRGLVFVPCDELPAIVPQQFDEHGRPLWLSGIQRRRSLPDGEFSHIDPRGYIPLRNGLLELDAFASRGQVELRRHTPRFLLTNSLDYDLPVARMQEALDQGGTAFAELVGELAPRWLGFLGSVWEEDTETIDVLQEWFGYNLTTDNKLEKMMLLVGLPRSGKGTILWALETMLGEHNICPMNLQAISERFGLIEAVGKNAAIFPDAHLGRYTDSAITTEVLKSWTGGDRLRVDERHAKRAFSVRLFAKITLACNELISLQDSSLGLASRMIVVRTGKSHQVDPDDTLKDDIGLEGTGLLLWALEGLRRLWSRQPRRIANPASTMQLMDEIRREQSPIHAFIEDCCLVGAERSIDVRELYDVWVHFCEEQGHKPGSVATFGRKLRAAVDVETEQPRDPETKKRRRRYRGITATADALAEAAGSGGDDGTSGTLGEFDPAFEYPESHTPTDGGKPA